MQSLLNCSQHFLNCLVLCFFLQFTLNSAHAEKVHFNKDIKPILSDTCFHCHGPDANARKANLRLDIRDAALKPADSGEIPIVPGKPEASEIIKRIFAEDAELLMPPDEAHKTLTPKQKELFKQWVKEGAEYEPHWAYAPLNPPKIPEVKAKEYVYNNIDHFIVDKLLKEGMSPSKIAEKHTLLRRLYLDLTGLPPTLAQQTEFLSDNSPQAYEKLVDKLLASPHYGERMASWWLDVARYTDTVGFHGDQNQRVFPYRDYVVNAFNKNLPFDQFTREQLAGDLLPNPTEDQMVATCFNRLNMMTREGGAQPREYLAKYGADRVRTIGTAWLGSTLACCECHSHKFDPFTIKDFYAMQAFFADVKQYGVYNNYGYTPEPELAGFNNDYPFPPEILVKSPYLKSHMQELVEKMQGQAEQLKKRLDADSKLAAQYQQWKKSTSSYLSENPTAWHTLTPEVTFVAPEADKKKTKKTSLKDQETATTATTEKETPTDYKITDNQEILLLKKSNNDIHLDYTPTNEETVSVIKLELIPHPEFDNKLRRDKQPGKVSLKFFAEVTRSDQEKSSKLTFHHTLADSYRPDYANGEQKRTILPEWQTLESNNSKTHHGYWFLSKPLHLKPGDLLTIRLESASTLGCIRVSTSSIVSPELLRDLSEKNPLSANSPESNWLETFLASQTDASAEWNIYRALLNDYIECDNGQAWCQVTKQMKPLTIRVLPRGNWQDESGEIVLPQPPEFLAGQPAPESQRKTRLDLANWLCSKENPLTSRNVMNRLWKQFFGNGISSVVEDLGAQGEPPSHPELLDYLAVEFRDHGWDFKRMIKMIVMSRTYQQTASLNPAYREKDPANRLLSSQNARRLDAEFVRDNALTIAGLINLKMGGPSCFPYQPAGYYRELQFPNRDYQANKDQQQYRRGLYMHWQRTFLHPMLANFDAPNRDECTANRVYSNTPQQALTLLNDPSFTESSRVLAAHLIDQHQDSLSRLELAYQLALARKPQTQEVESLQALSKELNTYYSSHPEDAQKLVQIGLKPDTTHNMVELAVWTNLCRVILNLHETITRY